MTMAPERTARSANRDDVRVTWPASTPWNAFEQQTSNLRQLSPDPSIKPVTGSEATPVCRRRRFVRSASPGRCTCIYRR